MDKIQYLHQTCDTPGEAVQQIQGRNCVEIGKYRVHPYDPEHTGAHDHHHRRLFPNALEAAMVQSINAEIP